MGDKLVDFHVADNNRMGAIDWERRCRPWTRWATRAGTVEFVAIVDRSRVSERTEITGVSESEGTQGMEQFLRDHGTGTVPAELYDQYVQDSIDRLKKAAESVGQTV